MQEVYNLSSSDRVKRLENDLAKDLQELQIAIEENDFLSNSTVASKTFSSLPLPKDVGHFQRERKIALTKALQVREARGLKCQADLMNQELMISQQLEYTNKSLPLILHQFFVEKVSELVQCKHMYMLRWARFCEHSKTIEELYPVYQDRLCSIMNEYQDTLERARRLSVAREAVLAGNETAMNVVTLNDLLIYTRSFVCQRHAVKRIHTFLKLIEWLPYSHANAVRLEKTDISTDDHKKPKEINLKAKKRFSKVMNQVSVVMQLNLLKQTGDSSPSPSPLSLSSFQLGAPKSPSIAVGLAASGGGLGTDELNAEMPFHGTSLNKLKPTLNFLLGCYAIDMDVHQINTFADEMELFTLVLQKFNKIFLKQEQLRTFHVYDAFVEDFKNMKGEGSSFAYKKECNWVKFLHIKPELNGDQVRCMTGLRQANNIDELLKIYSSFLRVKHPQRVIEILREHARKVVEPTELPGISVTTHKTKGNTLAVWKKIFEQTFTQSMTSREVILDFDTKLGEDMRLKTDPDLSLGTAADMLGLEDRDSLSCRATQGAYMSYLLLRHLRIRDLQRTCLAFLNYFRSIERTLTINDSGLSLENERQHATGREVFHSGGLQGLSSHQYLHHTPADFVVDSTDFMKYSEVENHDDFYKIDEGRVHVQDQRGVYIMYEESLKDFRNLEKDLLLVASRFIEKYKRSSERKCPANHVDIVEYGHAYIDRFGIILDIWSNEASYLENKRQLLDTYYEAYQHTYDREQKRQLSQVIVNILHQRPRFDLRESYFVKLYRAESVCLRLQCDIIKNVLDDQISEQREYVQKVTRDGKHEFGLPHRIIPKQKIAVNLSRPCLKYVYMLEYHPSLGLASLLPQAIQHTLKVFVNVNKPSGSMELIKIERCLLEIVQKEWDQTKIIGSTYSQQVQKDFFSDVFIEDPIFVCEVGQSKLNAFDTNSTGRKSVKERQQALIKTWCDLLEVLNLRHRFVTSAYESEVLMKIYKNRCKDFAWEDHHSYLRAVSFDFAQLKPEAELHRISIDSLLQDDGRIDRYTPGSLPLAIQEIDEKHIGSMNFRTREGVLQIISRQGIERMKVMLSSQVVHKNLLASAVILGIECENAIYRERRLGTTMNKSVQSKSPAMMSADFRDLSSHETSGTTTPTQMTFTSHVRREHSRVPKLAFVSLQLEKVWLRDVMLNDYVRKKNTMSIASKNIEETMKVKRNLIHSFCQSLQKTVSEYSMRAQIISYYGSLLDLLAEFPSTRDSHFILGMEFTGKVEETEVSLHDNISRLTPRSPNLLSIDGLELINLWYIPHFSEILTMFAKLSPLKRIERLKTILQIVSSLHDICHYLCAHARLGSSHARLGSQKLQFSGVTADWGGTEGIGAELREIQKHINHLTEPCNSTKVAEFLQYRRDVMYLEFDISVSCCVPGTFLQTGNEASCASVIDNMEYPLQNLSNIPRCSLYNTWLPIPEPFQSLHFMSSDLVPWRSFLAQNGPFPLQYSPWFDIGKNMQHCLAGLRDVDRHVVNGEILGVSLQLEDILQNGASHELLSHPYVSGVNPLDIQAGPLSFTKDPLSSIKLLQWFLICWSRVELLKKEWCCRKLKVNSLMSAETYHASGKVFRVDVLEPVYQQISLKKGITSNYAATVSDDDPIFTPPGTNDVELKGKVLNRLLENFECIMIADVMKKISREHTLVLTERSREDTTLPTDLWKNPIMKESTTIEKPQLVENFVQNLMLDGLENNDTICFDKTHFQHCLAKLASEAMAREQSCFTGYAMFYENLLRHQHQLLYSREQEIKQLRDAQMESASRSRVNIDCQLAEKTHELLLEITALRAKIAELYDEINVKESEVNDRLKKNYNTLVRDLFTRCFSMKNKFEEFRLSLHDDVLDSLGDVRRQAMENMRKIRERSGTFKDDADNLSKFRMENAERIRRYQEENKNLGALFYKIKIMNFWKNTRMSSHYFQTVSTLRDEADRAKKQCLDTKRLSEEREILLKQEQTALREALETIEKESEILRKKLSHQEKTKFQKTHARIQEKRSLKSMELARSTNIDKLISDLDERESQLREMTSNLLRDQKKNMLAKEHSKKKQKQLLHQLELERNLKLGAFERVDELQRQVYEQVYELPTTIRPQTTPPSLLPPTSSNNHRRRAYSSKVYSQHSKNINVLPPNP